MAKKALSAILYFLFGFFAMSALFGVAKAAWNTPVTNGDYLSRDLWNQRDDKISELEARIVPIRNILPGVVCGITSQYRTSACRPADPPPPLSCLGGDMNNPGSNGLDLCIR